MRFVVGIDEVGRGPLAGPVVVAAAMIPVNIRFPRYLGKLRDSKQLSVQQRENWFSYITDHTGIRYAVARVYPRMIDKLNIARAANLAASRAFAKLIGALPAKASFREVILDGGLYLGNGSWRASYGDSFLRRPEVSFSVSTIVRADETVPAVKIASIIAKVTRDRHMVRMARRYPAYGFDVHKGYGTAGHLRALRRHGVTPLHRLTFLGKYPTLKQTTHGWRSSKTPYKG